MESKLTKFWKWIKTHWVITTIGAIILSGVGGTLGDYLTNIMLIDNALAIIVSFLAYNVNLPLWTILITFIAILILFKFDIFSRYGTKNVRFEKILPDYVKDYTSYIYKGVKWTWDYTDIFDITNLQPHCLKCNTILKYPNRDENNEHKYTCEYCNTNIKAKYWGIGENNDMMLRIIRPKIKEKADIYAKKTNNLVTKDVL